MRVKVCKYGGSSLATPEKLEEVARQVVDQHRTGYATAVVVSAMGETTDELLGLAQGVSEDPNLRELDVLLSAGERISTALLALAVGELGVDAISLTGGQGGIRTSDRHFNADIEDVEPRRIVEELEQGRVVIVAGFQGESSEGETTTLGRGGSDTSAVVLAAALGAERCEIFSDVDGVFTADPRVVETARPLDTISYEEMLELARHGAAVLNPVAVEHARDLGVCLRAASTFSDAPGTIVTTVDEDRDEPLPVKGVACHRELIRMSMEPCASLEQEVLDAGGQPDVYLGGTLEDDGVHDVFVCRDSIADEQGLSRRLEREFGSRVRVEGGIGSASVIGRGLGSTESVKPGLERASRRLGPDRGSHIASDHSHTFLLDSDRIDAAARVLHGELVEPVLERRGAPA